MYNIRRFVGSNKELQELKKALETNDTKIIQKYIDLTRQRMVKRNRTNQLKTFEHILKQPRKTKPPKHAKKTTDLWKMFKMTKPRKSYF
jgi:NAD(P)H-nitrite reductase large subunit